MPNVRPTVQRNRKLTPSAKAKAKASASKALREQIQARAAGVADEYVTLDEDAKSAAIAAALQEEATSPQVTQTVRRLRDVFAYATAESYNLEAIWTSKRLPAHCRFIQDGEAIYVPHWPPERKEQEQELSESSDLPPPLNIAQHGGEAFIFSSGSYVTWGMTLEQSRKFLHSVIRGRTPATGSRSVEVNAYNEIGDEAMEFIMIEEQYVSQRRGSGPANCVTDLRACFRITRIVGDLIVIGRPPQTEEEELEDSYTDMPSTGQGAPDDPDWTPLMARLAFSQGLCRSARLSVQEAALSAYLEEVAAVPGRLEAEGKVPIPRRQIIRKMGTLLKLRQRANLDTENFLDDPEMYWDNAQLENHYDSVCLVLDIESRFKAYNEKLDHGENLLGVLRALLTEASTQRMELCVCRKERKEGGGS